MGNSAIRFDRVIGWVLLYPGEAFLFLLSLPHRYAALRRRAQAARYWRTYRKLRVCGQRWNSLASLPPEVRRGLRRRFLEHEAVTETTERVSLVLQIWLIMVFELGAIVLWLERPGLTHIYGISVDEHSSAWVLAGIVLFTCFILIGLVADFYKERYLVTAIAWTMLFLPLLFGAASLAGSFFTLSENGIPSPSFFIYGVSSISIYLMGAVTILIVVLVSAVIRNLFETRYPHASIVRRLSDTLAALERHRVLWLLPASRASAIARIDRAATLVQWRLFRSLRTTDQATRAWRDDRAQRVSHALREKERWLITPKADTREVLLERLSDFLSVFLTGAWDLLEAAEGDLPRALPTVRGIMRMARAVIIGFLPAALFGAGRHWQVFSLGSPLDDYVLGGLALWGLVSLISVSDPLFKENLSAVKEIVSMIRGGGKKDT